MMLLRRSIFALMVMIFAAACYPDYDAPQRPQLPEMSADYETTDNELPYAVVEMDNNSDVRMAITSLEMLAEQEAATTGKLEMRLSFSNDSDEAIALNFNEDDFNLIDSNGLPVPPTEVDTNLTEIRVPANETFVAELEYPTLDTLSTYVFALDGFDDVVVDVSTSPAS